ncbi:bcl-2 homologous antagonist/killer-like isoform X2 [Acanthaster planci]|uniref:Bcl-2 homologous antagonist/killer-like isoform X2 n=1 Tax=Acanthaster planci TaxID=133434 RepID=A0A8B7ZRC4_ACAPL|nr:bcl-2 homologous antagonist/killer-like isoform X2 [Acanthaster planci]
MTMGQFSPVGTQCMVCTCTSPVSLHRTLSLRQENDNGEETRRLQQPQQPQEVPFHAASHMRLNDVPTASLAQRRLSRASAEPAMATYQSTSTETTERLSPDTEDNVVEQTESIVRNYMFIRYQTDLQSEESELAIATPRIPEFQCFTANPLSPTSQIGRRLAQIGDEINSQYECEFRDMISQLRITPATAYEAFARVARRLFTQGINWGRIAALLSFGYQVAISVKAGIGEFIGKIIGSIVQFICTERIAQWISQQGGWRAALSYQLESSEGFRLFLAVSVAVATTAGIMYWIGRR